MSIVDERSRSGPGYSGGGRRRNRLSILRYVLVGCALLLGTWFFNVFIAIGAAALLLFAAPYVAYPGDALRYLRQRGRQRQYLAAIEAGNGEKLEFGESPDLIAQAIGGDILPFRVFISSTFQDLAYERDLLAKDVFPRLAIECDRRGAVWAPIDLRWGITELQQDAGQVVGICLNSVERSRPNTIGIVGGRYGSLLPVVARQDAELPGWIADSEGLSVTHLELRQAMHLDPEELTVFVMERAAASSGEQEAIGRMLGELGGGGAKVIPGFADGARLAQAVEDELMRRLERQVPDSGVDNLMLREISAHSRRERLLAERPTLHVGVLAEVNEAIAREKGVVVRGEPGSGRSTLLAAWVRAWRREYPDDIVVCRFVGLTDSSRAWQGLLRSILAELSIRTGRPMRLPELDEDLALSAAFRIFEAQTGGRRVVLAIDGLDQLVAQGELEEIGARGLAWLPQKGPHSNLRFVPKVATDGVRDGADYAGSPVIIEVPPLTPADRAILVAHSLSAVDRALPESDVRQIVAHTATGSPAFLGLLLDELHKVPSHERLGPQLRYLLESQTLDELAAKAIKRVEEEVGPDRAASLRAVMALLADSASGYTEVEIVDIVSRLEASFSQTEFEVLRWRLATMLSEADGAFQVATSFAKSVRQWVVRDDLEAELRRARVSLFAYGPRRFTARSVRELAGMPSGGDDGVLRDIAGEPRGIAAMREAFGSGCCFVLGRVAESAGCRVRDILGQAAGAIAGEPPDVQISVAEMCFDYGLFELVLPIIDSTPNDLTAREVQRYSALVAKLDLVGVRRLTAAQRETMLRAGCSSGSGTAWLALCGLSSAAAARGDYYWAKKYQGQAIDVTFARGNAVDHVKSVCNKAILLLEGEMDLIRTPVGQGLASIFDDATRTGFSTGDLWLLMESLYRMSVVELMRGDPQSAFSGLRRLSGTAIQMGDDRWRRLADAALAVTLTALGRDDDGLVLASRAGVTLEEAVVMMERRMLSFMS